MLNKTIEGISQVLTKEFGEEYSIYMDSVTQSQRKKCFLVTPLNPSQEHRVGNQYERYQPFDIQYFPMNAEVYTSECMEVTERLFDILEYINVGGDLVRGTNMNANIQEGVLHFFVDYNMFIIKQHERINMEEVQSDVNLKEGK